jgi:hypothetical protein
MDSKESPSVLTGWLHASVGIMKQLVPTSPSSMKTKFVFIGLVLLSLTAFGGPSAVLNWDKVSRGTTINDVSILGPAVLPAGAASWSGISTASGRFSIVAAPSPNYAFPSPVTIGGTVYYGGGTNWLKNDTATGSGADWLYMQLGSGIGDFAVCGFAQFNATGSGGQGSDMLYITSSSSSGWGVLDFVPSSTSSQLRAHGQDTGGTSLFGSYINPTPNKTYYFVLYRKTSSTTVYIRLYDPANSYALVASSSCACGTAQAYFLAFISGYLSNFPGSILWGDCVLVNNATEADLTALLTVGNTAPAIISQPSSLTCLTNTNASFALTASGTAPLNYHWRTNGVPVADGVGYSGSTSSSLWVSNVVIAQSNWNFACVVANASGSVTSSVATLTVTNGSTVGNAAPAITSQPSSVTCLTNTTVSFALTASGTAPLSYHWRTNGVPVADGAGYSGSTSSSLWVSNVVMAQGNGNFACVVANASGSVTSAPATLTVTAGTSGGADTNAIISSDRVIPWSSDIVGVPGGIPNRTTIYTTLSSGATAAQISSAIANCPSNQVVKLSAGTYTLSGQIHWLAKSGVSLRGAGMGQTILNISSVAASIGGGAGVIDNTTGSFSTSYVNITGGYTKGSSNLVVSSASGFSPGTLITMTENDEPGLVFTSSPSNPRHISVLAMVTAVNGTTISIWPPLPYSFQSSLSPQVTRATSTMKFAGIEDMTIDAGTGSTALGNLWWDATYGCWLKNVEWIGAGIASVQITRSLQDEVRHCYFHDQAASQDGVGLMLQGTYLYHGCTAILIEDNIFTRVNYGVVLEQASECVMAYNFVTNSVTRQTTWVEPAYNSCHLAHCLMNLWEGNIGEEFQADGYHGSSSHNTLLRNWFHGLSTNPTKYLKTMDICRVNYYYNAVGNILGSPTWSGSGSAAYEMSGQPDYTSEPCIYRLGYPNMGNNSYANAAEVLNDSNTYPDANVKGSLVRAGNYDYYSKAMVWDTSITARTIPNSYVYSSKPSYFGSLTWPPFDPANPGSASPTSIPAGYRYVLGVDPPVGTTGNNPPVALAGATPTNGTAPLTVSFSSAGSSDPEGAALTYNWTFGDGTTSTAANPSHTYSLAGNYSAQLTVSDGTNTASSRVLTVTASAVVAQRPPAPTGLHVAIP